MAQESRQDISLVRAARTEPPSFPSTATATITLGEYLGITKDATFEVSTKLDRARLKATVPGFVDESGAEAPAVVDLTWTGAGELFRETDRIRVKFPGSMLTQWFKGTFRPAQVSGTVLVGKKNHAADPRTR